MTLRSFAASCEPTIHRCWRFLAKGRVDGPDLDNEPRRRGSCSGVYLGYRGWQEVKDRQAQARHTGLGKRQTSSRRCGKAGLVLKSREATTKQETRRLEVMLSMDDGRLHVGQYEIEIAIWPEMVRGSAAQLQASSWRQPSSLPAPLLQLSLRRLRLHARERGKICLPPAVDVGGWMDQACTCIRYRHLTLLYPILLM